MNQARAHVPVVEGTESANSGMSETYGQPPQAGWLSLAPLPAMLAVLYFLVLRPQQKKLKEQQNLIANLKLGDEVVTLSGILGKIAGLTEQVVTLEVAEGVRIKVLRSQMNQVVKGSLKEKNSASLLPRSAEH